MPPADAYRCIAPATSITARELGQELQEHRVGLRRNCLHPLWAAQRHGALLEQVRRAAAYGPEADGGPSGRC